MRTMEPHYIPGAFSIYFSSSLSFSCSRSRSLAYYFFCFVLNNSNYAKSVRARCIRTYGIEYDVVI